MTGNDEDDQVERRRKQRERAQPSPEDRLLGEIRTTKSGLPDGRSRGKRKYRVVQMPLHVRLRTRAMIDFIIERDHHPSRDELLEEMLDAYLEKYGAIDKSLLPTDEELVEGYLKEQEKRDAE